MTHRSGAYPPTGSSGKGRHFSLAPVAAYPKPSGFQYRLQYAYKCLFYFVFVYHRVYCVNYSSIG